MAKSGGRSRTGFVAGLGLIAFAATCPAYAEPAPSAPPEIDRQERWRAARSGSLQLPLPGTPDTERLLTRLGTAGLPLGAPMLIRAFKAESELEVWVQRRNTYVLFATYPVCYWSGNLGPKLREGDKQTPEGFYALSERELHHGDRWRRSLNIGYPNVFDRANGRSGSNILVHGGCDSIGCFAVTDPVNAELYDLVAASLRAGADYVPMQIFPFRMTDANLAANGTGPWQSFWSDLKLGYDSFERTRLPPNISVCGRRYHVRDNSPFSRNSLDIELCAEDRNLVPDRREEARARPTAQDPGARLVRASPPPRCSTARASCRKWVALRDRRATSRTVARQTTGGKKRSAVR